MSKDRPLIQYYGRMVDGIMIEDGDHQPINTLEAMAVRKKYGIEIDEGTYGKEKHQKNTTSNQEEGTS